MDAPLHECNIERQRTVVRFLWFSRVSPADIRRRAQRSMEQAPKPNERCMSGWTALERRRRCNGRKSKWTPKNISHRRKGPVGGYHYQGRSKNHSSASCGILGHHFESTYAIVHDELGYHKVCARWVPRNSQLNISSSASQ